MSRMKRPGRRPPVAACNYLAPLLVIALATSALYGGFLASPLVFDDFSYFSDAVDGELKPKPDFGLRWLPVASFTWIHDALGAGLIWQRAANLALHIVNSSLLFVFLARLFECVIPKEQSGAFVVAGRTLPTWPWLAFSGALWFALNPAAVYGVAYLAQRTILMTSLFALLTWLLLLEGVVRERQRWLLASCLAYLLAVYSKEHALMVPAVAFAVTMLVRKPSRRLWIQLGPTFFLYGLIAAYTYYQVKSGGVVGRPYEPNAYSALDSLGIDPAQSYALSVVTQGFLFFKYLLLWIVPNPGWMSVDMVERFVRSYFTWPETPVFLAFLSYPLLAAWLLWQRGRLGLLGFAMLVPWLLFATEIATVRMQEMFVLYRSYLWMPCLAAALPVLIKRVPVRYAIAFAVAVPVALSLASWNRLSSFSDSFLLWDDALRKAEGRGETFRLGRMYHNRGVAHLGGKRYEQAIRDFNAALDIFPNYTLLYNDRAVAYLETGQYQKALRDYDQAILLKPDYYNPYLGRALVHEALGNVAAARLDYGRSCRLGVQEVCAQGQ